MVFLLSFDSSRTQIAKRPAATAQSATAMLISAATLLLLSGPLLAQEGGTPTLTVVDTTSGMTITQGSTDLIPAGNTLLSYTLTMSGVASCDKTTVTTTFSWVDSHNPHPIPPQTENYTITGPTSITAYQGGVGGTAVFNWQVNGGTTHTLSFTVLGNNPTPPQVDQFLASVKANWYMSQILQQESNYRQFTSTHSPLVAANPDGVGMGQIDGTKTNMTLGIYFQWDYSNILDGAMRKDTANQTAGVAFWNKQVSEATSAHPPPATPAAAGVTLPYCSIGTSAAHPWSDSEAITAYNGTGSVTGTCPNGTSSQLYPTGYFIVWTGTNATNGVWKLNVESSGCFTGRSYVGDVCGKPAQ